MVEAARLDVVALVDKQNQNKKHPDDACLRVFLFEEDLFYEEFVDEADNRIDIGSVDERSAKGSGDRYTE